MNNKDIRRLSGYQDFKSVLNSRITKDDYCRLYQHALSIGVSLSNFKDYTGKISVIDDLLNKIAVVAEDFPNLVLGKRHVVIVLKFINNDIFAYTYKNIITLNGILYNDDVIASEDYLKKVNENIFVKGTTWEDVIFHELGHVVCYMYKLEPLQIAKEIIGTNNKAEIIEYVATNLSIYSATTFNSLTKKVKIFDGTEIIAECFCGYYGGANNKFANKYVERCKQIVLERKVTL